MAVYILSVFPVCSPYGGGSLQAPLCPPPILSRDKVATPNENDKGENKRHARSVPYSSPASAMNGGVQRDSGSFSPSLILSLAPGASASASHSSCRSRHFWSSHSNTSLAASSSFFRSGTSLPTSVEERKSSTTYPHLLSAIRSWAIHPLFHLLVFYSTSAHRVFCSFFHTGHTLKRWSLVCEEYLHHQNLASGPTLAQCRYCPVWACALFSW